MKKFYVPVQWEKCNVKEQQSLLARPLIITSNKVTQTVQDIIERVRSDRDKALRSFSLRFDKIKINKFQIDSHHIAQADAAIDKNLKHAINKAFINIKTFHKAQTLKTIDIETQPGVRCQQVTRPINCVGLYIPGGSVTLFSTLLMLAIPAKIAGCNRIVVCSPPPITNEILYSAYLCGITEIFQIGGAQAIAALAFGTESIPKVDKIFGPGNIYVTETKRQVSQYFDGAAIDMPAGPSEIMIIADNSANPAFVAADLLSQAEHGADSQVILLTPEKTIISNVIEEIQQQINHLKRKLIIEKSFDNSSLIIARDLDQCLQIANQYGPEHLIIQTENPRDLLEKITNAGSVFLGKWSPGSAGDYASGTNHVLPTYGYTNTYSSLGVIDFQKRMVVQELTQLGLVNLSETIQILAEYEQMEAHKKAVALRIAAI
ncbi:histidinol dehydrogenase [Candidatus Ishikawella capsulata]|nr:histidinol dehydrogenase [Candidatus Ishikawaella capsulata]